MAGHIGELPSEETDVTTEFQIYRMQRQHRRLAEMIDYESGMPVPDDARIRELKRRKLRLRDQLTVLETQFAAP